MKSNLLPRIAAGAAASVVACLTVLAPIAAHADGGPSWEPDNTTEVGTLTFYDASGNIVSSGNVKNSPFVAYAAGSATVRDGDSQALLELAQPNPSADPGEWNVDILGGPTSLPLTTGPSALQTLSQTEPVAAGTAGDDTLAQFINAFPNSDPSGPGCAYSGTVAGCTNTAYQNIYQVRLVTSNGSDNTQQYDVADVAISNATYSGGVITSGTWTQIYPAPFVAPNTTTTSLAATPSTSSSQGGAVMLTASVTTSDSSSPDGTVQFMDGTTDLGSPVGVDPDSATATYSTSSLSPGRHSLTATFTPADTLTYSGSTSDPLAYVVNPVAAKPSISGTAKVGDQVTCNEPTTLGEAVSVAWKLNGTKSATGRNYTLPGTAAGKSLTCTATVSVTGGTSSSATSAAKKVALGNALKNKKAPKLSGPGKVGKTEKVSKGSWSPGASSYSYQWLLGGKKIKGATKSSFKIAKKDKGKKLSCSVTAKKTGYAAGTAKSKAVKVKK